MQISHEKQTLDNGLDVIVHMDRTCPIVAVNIWYHVGSKNEQPGRTGFAHLFEHLMFEGSEHHDRGYFHPLQEAGGALNGSTSADRTNYWEVVPTGALERALWMESDRMGFLLPALTPEKFETQRQVVLNERRQNYENRPYGMVPMVLMPALFPQGHPYRWLTIGEPADLEAASLDDVRRFFQVYYHPGNASLVLAGDVDVDRAFELARQYFGSIPGGPEPPPVVVDESSATSEESRLVLEDRVELPRLYLSWRSPPLFGEGDAELDILASILTGGRSSRLYRDLVCDLRIATDVSAGQGSRELAGTFSIVATASPGHALEELEAAITEQLMRLVDAGSGADEVRRTQTTVEADFAYRLQNVGEFGGRSDQLNAYNVYLKNPDHLDADLSRYLSADSEAVRSATQRFVVGPRRVALSVIPRGHDTSAALPGSVSADVAHDG